MKEASKIESDDARDDDYMLHRDIVLGLRRALEIENKDQIKLIASELHRADLADLIEQIDPDERETLVQLLGYDLEAELLSELEEGVRDEVIEFIDPGVLAEAVKELDSDDVVYLVEDMEEGPQRAVLDALEDTDRAAVEKSLQYPEDSAGRLMQREMVVAPAYWTVGQAIDYMRESDHLPDPFYEIYLVDPNYRPVGEVSLSTVMGQPRDVVLNDIMTTKMQLISVDQAQEDVAYAFNQYHLVSAPVIDESGRITGMITIDDAMQVLDEEAEEDLLRLGGVGDEELSDAVLEIAKRRFPWLAVNLLTSILASLIIAMFDATIEQIVALAVLMPIVASMGGNAGTQTLTVSVRALATKDLTPTNAMRVIGREALVGIANGIVFAVIIGLVGYLWYESAALGIVLGIAMIGNMFVAALAGILIPLALDKIGWDPALASGAFVTTVTDIVGFLAFLGLASMVLL